MVDTRSTLLSGIRYILVGVASVGVYVGLAAALNHALAFPPLLANSISYIAASVANYLGHYYWSFATIRPHTGASWRYVTVVCAGVALNFVFVAALMRTTQLPLEVIGLIFSFLWPIVSFVSLHFWAMPSKD